MPAITLFSLCSKTGRNAMIKFATNISAQAALSVSIFILPSQFVRFVLVALVNRKDEVLSFEERKMSLKTSSCARMMLVTLALFLTFFVGIVSPVSAAGVTEGAIWDYQGVDLYGHNFQNSLMIRHGHLINVLSDGSQLDYGAVTLNSYNEFEVRPARFKPAFPAVGTMTFKFGPDFSSVTETHIMNFGGRCVAGDCSNNVVTLTYQRR
jgi:hypothetical protein